MSKSKLLSRTKSPRSSKIITFRRRTRGSVYYYDEASGLLRKRGERRTLEKEADGRPLYCASPLIAIASKDAK